MRLGLVLPSRAAATAKTLSGRLALKGHPVEEREGRLAMKGHPVEGADAKGRLAMKGHPVEGAEEKGRLAVRGHPVGDSGAAPLRLPARAARAEHAAHPAEVVADAEKPKRRKRRQLVRRGELRDLAPAEKHERYHAARMESLVGAIPDKHILLTLGKGDPETAARQVPDPARRREQMRTLLMEKGGKRGEGLDPILRAIEMLRERAVATNDPDPLCMSPMVSAALVNELVGLERERSVDAGVRCHNALVWMQQHFRWPIDVDKRVTEAAAERGTSAAGKQRRGEKRRRGQSGRAGTHPIGYKCALEYQARHAASEFVRHIAQSNLVAGIDVSIRVEDSESAEARRGGCDDERHVRLFAPLTKDGSPIELHSVARGFLGAYEWYPEWLARVERLGGRLFPKWVKPYRSGGSILAATAWCEHGSCEKEEIRQSQIDIAAMAPYEMPASDWGKGGGGLNLTGHSQHGSGPDWARTIGPLPVGLPYAAELAEDPPRGFLREESRAYGHWLRDAEEEESGPPTRWQQTDAGVRPARGGPGAAAHAEMLQRYTEGEGRVGERVSQIRMRGRMADYGAAAIAGWCKHWGVPWWRMPLGRADVEILVRPPEEVPPRPAA